MEIRRCLDMVGLDRRSHASDVCKNLYPQPLLRLGSKELRQPAVQLLRQLSSTVWVHPLNIDVVVSGFDFDAGGRGVGPTSIAAEKQRQNK